MPAAHTNAVVFMIGEKAADMVKDTWLWIETQSSKNNRKKNGKNSLIRIDIITE